MKFILFNGPSCTGKSTIVKRILAEREKMFLLSYDSLKWSFSHYHHSTHIDDVKTLVRAVAESVCTMGYDIVSDAGLHKDTRDKLLAIPRTHGYEVIEINLEADYDVLLARFDARVADALAKQSKTISNTSRERFKELHDTYQSEKNPSAIIFKTDSQSEDEIVASILKML